MSRKSRLGARASAGARPGAATPKAPRDTQALVLALVLAAVGALAYAGTVGGAFVYDDVRQIVRNTLIQDGAQFWRALGSDVWAFKGGTEPVSNYWRPSFVLWLIANFNVFGVQQAAGWHVANILLHALVVVLAFVLGLRLGLPALVAAAVALVFAVHPAHVESVAWISGSPDLILAASLLGALLLVPSLAAGASRLRWAAALGLYAVALGAKESAILFPAIVVALLWRRADGGAPAASRALRVAAPFAALAALYFLARLAVLGVVTRAYPGGAGTLEALLSAPSVFVFYLRQALLPLTLGPSYPLRAVSSTTLGLANFAVPLLLTLVALFGLALLARRSPVALFGAALFLLSLAPAFNIAAFQPEQLVHDRYLYLPLLGLELCLFPALYAGLERAGWKAERAQRAVLACAVVAGLAFALQTLAYNQAWRDELSLWQRGVVSDPTSAFNHLQYGAALEAASRYDEARAALDRSLAIRPIPNAQVARARVAVAQQRFADAEQDLRAVLDGAAGGGGDAYTLYQGYEALALGYERQGRFDAAAATLTQARARLPLYAAALTEKLAVVLYQAGQKAQALAELEAHRAAAVTESLPESRDVLFRLGLLYAELGRGPDARAAFQAYLDATATLDNPQTRPLRAQAQDALRALPR